MASTRIQCDGCARVFAPRSLSMHLRKTQDPRCRRSITGTRYAMQLSPDRRAEDTVATQVSQDMDASPVRRQDGKFAVGLQGSAFSFLN